MNKRQQKSQALIDDKVKQAAERLEPLRWEEWANVKPEEMKELRQITKDLEKLSRRWSTIQFGLEMRYRISR